MIESNHNELLTTWCCPKKHKIEDGSIPRNDSEQPFSPRSFSTKNNIRCRSGCGGGLNCELISAPIQLDVGLMSRFYHRQTVFISAGIRRNRPQMWLTGLFKIPAVWRQSLRASLSLRVSQDCAPLYHAPPHIPVRNYRRFFRDPRIFPVLLEFAATSGLGFYRSGTEISSTLSGVFQQERSPEFCRASFHLLLSARTRFQNEAGSC